MLFLNILFENTIRSSVLLDLVMLHNNISIMHIWLNMHAFHALLNQYRHEIFNIGCHINYFVFTNVWINALNTFTVTFHILYLCSFSAIFVYRFILFTGFIKLLMNNWNKINENKKILWKWKSRFLIEVDVVTKTLLRNYWQLAPETFPTRRFCNELLD